VDSSNHVYGEINTSAILSLKTVVAGSTTTLATTGSLAFTVYELGIAVYANGTCVLTAYDLNGVQVAQLQAATSTLATGGTLDDGKPGFADDGSGTTQYWDDFFVFTPPAEDVALYSGETIQFRHDDVIHENSIGTETSRFQPYRGSRFLVPVGDSYVTVKARRTDIETAADADVTDSTRIQVGWTPRGLAVPR
jgi:hypothetical protein